ncbi:MAG: hypothetical protein WCG25_00345 [bacterium]
MFYKEKINKHINTTNGQREIDPDGYANGLSACTDPNTETCQLENPNRWGKKKLEYCKRFYPDTVSIRPFAWEKSIRWIPQRANNANS